LKFKAPDNIGFFTIFDKYVNHRNTIANEMKSMHGDIKKIDDNIYWIGSPIVEDGIVSDEYYFSSLKCYCKTIGLNCKIIYIPHRRESVDKINRIKNEIGITINYIDCPIELFFLNEDSYPKIVISFFSTALFTL